MTKTKIFTVTAFLLVLITVCCAGTSVNAYASSAEVRYSDAPLLSPYSSIVINYTRREITAENYTDGNCPYYYPVSGLTNACGAVAGSEVVAFYDKYFPELIPDWVSYYPASGKYRVQDFTYVPSVMREMYTLMRTNVEDVGVSRTECLDGLRSYINGRGRQVSYQSVTSGSSINFEQCKNAIDNNKVILLFTLPTTVYAMSEANNSDSFFETNIAGAHIMVAFGYLQIKYYNNGGLFRTDTFLQVAMGQPGYTEKMYKIDSATTEAAYIVNIQ